MSPGLPAEVGAWQDAGPGRVVVRRRDVLDLRAAAPPAGAAHAVGLWLEDAPAALTVVPPPTWPPLTHLGSRVRPPGLWTVLEFAESVEVAEVVAELARQAVRPSVVVVPPAGLDSRVLNPTGFRARVAGPVVDARHLDLRHGATPGLVARLREHAGVRVRKWDDAALRAAPGLAAAGVPLVTRKATPGLDPAVLEAMRAKVDLADPLAREEHSIVLRRAALDAYAPAPQPEVSVLLATRRPEMLHHALAQVARQRGVARLELVLATHGFAVEPAAVREALREAGGDVALQVLPQPAEAVFGDVLHAASGAAGGEVLMKWDDDDWYAPDAVADLLRARAYSGADLVGMPPETHYVAAADRTVFKGHPSEKWANFVAGGTMMLDHALLREIGGFRRVRRYVDAQLLEAVMAAGGAVYRTHGLGYLLHRTAGGHTWQIDLDTLLDPARMVASRPGLHPSRLLELG